MRHFKIKPGQRPNAAERALMYMVDSYEAIPHVIRGKNGEEIRFYKLLIL